ncbi:MAG: hypothetical protein Q9220_001994 [cf. Caloplaca sp. 1 TL-2023]
MTGNEVRRLEPSTENVLHLVKVSESNKSILFHKGSDDLPETKRNDRAVLERLQKIYPPALYLFGLKDTAVSQAPLRLLLENQTRYGYRDPLWVDSYIALSYCWHSDDWTPPEGLGPLRHDWPISSTMVPGFLALRRNEDEGLWVDTLCINQEDRREKSEVIGAMDLIYRSARMVVAVLEDISVNAAERQLLDEVKTKAGDPSWKTDQQSMRSLMAIFIRILGARWFKRAWCSHELQLGINLTFLVPTGESHMELSAESLELLHARTCDYHLVDDDFATLLRACFRSYVLFSRARETSMGQAAGRSLMSEFSDISSLQCSIESDKISIALNIAGLGLFFNGHSDSVETCRWILAMIALSADDASVLCGVGDQLVLHDGTRSWMHWPEESENYLTQIGVAHQTLAGSIGSVQAAGIELDLWAIGGCQLHWPHESLYRHVKDCLATFAIQCRECDPEARPNWMITRAEDKALRMDEDYIAEVLAASLDCGVVWMAQQMNHCKVLKQQLHREKMGLPVNLSQFLAGLMRGTGTTNWTQLTGLTPDKQSSLLLFVYFVMYHHPLGYGSSASCYPPPRTERVQSSSKWTRCGWVDLNTSGKALIALGAGDLDAETFLLSLPVALSGTACAMHNRGWVLQPCTGRDAPWILIGKFGLFTLVPIGGDNTVIRRMNNTLVSGTVNQSQVVFNRTSAGSTDAPLPPRPQIER